MQPLLSQSAFIVVTGGINSGKSFQLGSVLTAKVDGERFALPCAVILAESSGEGTLGEILLNPGACVVWPCSTCDQATEALNILFPDAGPLTLGQAKAALHKTLVARSVIAKSRPPEPPPAHPNNRLQLRSVITDTASSLYRGSEKEAYRQLLAEAGGKPGVSPGGKKAGDARYNDPRETHKLAAKRCGDMLDRLNGIAMANRGLIVLVSCHTEPAMQATKDGAICVGEVPSLGGAKTMAVGVDVPGFSKTWDALAAKANVIWHCFETIPDLSAGGSTDLHSINERAEVADKDGSAFRGVITRKGKYPGLGAVLWVKRQGGDGPLGVFGSLPAYWHPAVPHPMGTPNLGMVFSWAITESRKTNHASVPEVSSAPLRQAADHSSRGSGFGPNE